MNVTLNNNNLINQYRQNNYQVRPLNNQVHFTSVAATVNKPSSFFEPLNKLSDSVSEFFAKHLSSKFVDLKFIDKLSDKIKDSDNLFKFCMTVESMITSGLYVQQTLTKKDLDKDRRQVLATNQTLTFILATAGSYTIDKYLKSWWENTTAKFVATQLDDASFLKDFKDAKNLVKQINKDLKANPDKSVEDMIKNSQISDKAKGVVRKMVEELTQFSQDTKIKSVKGFDLDKFINILSSDTSFNFNKLSSDLSKKVKGMGLFKSMLVFGFIYRYFVPVAVTKPANIICEKYLANKKAKAAETNIKQDEKSIK